MAFPEKYRLACPHHVDREIEGQSFRFYTNSVRIASRMSALLTELAGHVATMLTAHSGDQGKVVEDWEDKQGRDATKVTKSQIQPIDPELAALRHKQKQDAIHGAIDALLGDKHRLSIGELMVNSLRDDFDRKNPPSTKEIQDWMDDMDLPVLIEFITGWAQANAKVFGNVGKVLGNQLKGAGDNVVERVQEALATAGQPSKTI